MLKDQTTKIILNLSLFAFVFTVQFSNQPIIREPGDEPTGSVTFTEFVNQVQNGEADVLRGVYVPDVLALPVRQQPADNPSYVSGIDGEVTQFSQAADLGNIGLLAHNNLSGKTFSQLTMGQDVLLVFGDGRVEHFVVSQIMSYQALQPRSALSTFRSLHGGEVLSAGELFGLVYSGGHHVTFQTCIQANGNMSWGRLFIVAVPATGSPESPLY